MTIIVSGANGYIGKAFLSRLLKNGHRKIRALVRSEKAKNELTNEVEGLDVVVVDYLDHRSIDSALLEGAHLFHLVGTIRQTRKFSFRAIHEDLCSAIVEAPTNLSKITSLSVTGASFHSINSCLKSRAKADRVFDTSSIPTAVVRIPMVLGGNGHASEALRKNARKRLVFSFRTSSLEQPIFLDDVVDILYESLKNRSLEGLFDLGGPESISRRELIRLAGQIVRMNPIIISLPLVLGNLCAWVFEKTQEEPLISRATLGVLDHDDYVDNSDTLAAFGLTLTPLDVMLKKVI